MSLFSGIFLAFMHFSLLLFTTRARARTLFLDGRKEGRFLPVGPIRVAFASLHGAEVQSVNRHDGFDRSIDRAGRSRVNFSLRKKSLRVMHHTYVDGTHPRPRGRLTFLSLSSRRVDRPPLTLS